MNKLQTQILNTVTILIAFFAPVAAQTNKDVNDQRHESARSDKFTGGVIEKTSLEPGEPDVRITINVPAFQLTLWQNNKEVKTYRIGVGLKDHPIVIGERQATEIIWNPAWIPPDSKWVHEMKGITPGEVIKAGDKRNPLGKLKIPLGGGYLIHEAAKISDLGNLVSHGCVRMLRSDLYDLAEKIIAAQSLAVKTGQIERAKRTKRMLVTRLDAPLPVDINYDTQVVEQGVLYLYPDVYDRGTDRVENLRAELESSGVDSSQLPDRLLRRMLSRPTARQKFVVSLDSVKEGRALADGRLEPLVRTAAKRTPSRRVAAPGQASRTRQLTDNYDSFSHNASAQLRSGSSGVSAT